MEFWPRSWKVMEFDNLDSRPGKSWNFGPGRGKSWDFMLAKLYAAELPTVLDCLTCIIICNLSWTPYSTLVITSSAPELSITAAHSLGSCSGPFGSRNFFAVRKL